ncbi:hypothetical protein D3C76_1176230 [compost metagenome]
MQVVTLGLLDGFRLIFTDTTGQVGNSVLFLALDLHTRSVDRFEAGGLSDDRKHRHADSDNKGQEQCLNILHDDASRAPRNPFVT